MYKKKSRGKRTPDEAGDGYEERPETSKKQSKESPQKFKKIQGSHQVPEEKGEKEMQPKDKEKPEETQEQQPQGAWGRGPPSLGSPSRQQQQQQQQPQGAKGRGLPPSGHPKQQSQGAWGRGPLSSGHPEQQQQQQQEQPQQQQQPQSAWGRGPPSLGSPSRQQQQQQQPQGAKGRGIPPSRHPKEQSQGAWGKGPLSSGHPEQQQQQQPPPQQQEQQQQQQQPPPQQQQQQPQVAKGRGLPPSGHPKQQSQGAWGRGLPPSGHPGQQQQQQQSQGAWGRGLPPSGHPGQPQQQQSQGAWGKGPLPSGPPQEQDLATEKKKGLKTPEMSKSNPKEKDFSDTRGFFEFAPRICAPKKSGRPIRVLTNFYPLIINNPDIVAYHYDVVIEPDKPKYLMRAVWNKFVSVMFPDRLVAFDDKNAYSQGPLTNEGTASATVTVENPESNREKEFKVTIQEVRRISFSVFKNFREKMLQSRDMKVLPEAELAVLEIIMRNWMCDNLVKSNRTFFTPISYDPLTYQLSEKLSLRIGHFQSAFLGYKPYLNFDISFKAFYKEIHLLELINCFKSRYNKDIDFDEMNSFLKTVKVEYQLPNDPSFRRIFRINKLVKNAKTQTFKKEDGTELSVAQYFETEKKYKLRYPELPLLWVGPTQKNIYIPMEFCRIAPDQIYKGLINPFEQREMVQKATSNARDRNRDVNALFTKININSTPLMKEFGLQVSDQMENVQARVLDPPRLKTSRNIMVRDGTWRIQDFFDPKSLTRWCILNLDNRTNMQSLINFQRMIKSKGTEYRMRIEDPSREPLNAEPSFSSLKNAFSLLRDMEMVFVVISEAKGVYQRVKAICETQEGVLTQCVRGRTLSQDPRKLSTTVQNILLKVNAKLGGKNHCLDVSCVPQCLKGYVMIIGADVTHPSPGMKIPSVAAVTVSCDPAVFQYGTTTRVQPKGEMIKDMEEIISINLKTFYQLRKCYPEKIIFFRDGVSEGELPKVFKNELLALRKACNGYCQPKITFVVVQKRHHTRFFPTCREDEVGKNFNVPVGTCVDTDIVHPKDLDFYLVSHESILGTARPTRYRLLYDDNKLTDDEVETLSFYLCHLFSRCNRSVSYPSPTYNAHLAAARVRAHLEGLNLMGGVDIERIKSETPDHISRISPMYYV